MTDGLAVRAAIGSMAAATTAFVLLVAAEPDGRVIVLAAGVVGLVTFGFGLVQGRPAGVGGGVGALGIAYLAAAVLGAEAVWLTAATIAIWFAADLGFRSIEWRGLAMPAGLVRTQLLRSLLIGAATAIAAPAIFGAPVPTGSGLAVPVVAVVLALIAIGALLQTARPNPGP